MRWEAMVGMESCRIVALKREIEAIQELNQVYRFQKHHCVIDKKAHEKRRIRLEEIKHQLAAFLQQIQHTCEL